ncbi:MAG: hypothetical protein ACRCT6_09730 [Notoacmeibacter sp.]
MFSTLFRLFGWLVLAGGVIVAIVDATKSVAANSLQLTRLGETLQFYSPTWAGSLAAIQENLVNMKILNWPLSNVIDYLNAIPVALLAAGLFLLIYGLASRNQTARHF